MATLAQQGRITAEIADDEIDASERRGGALPKSLLSSELILELLGEEAADRLDLFDVAQLAVVLQTCRDHVSASAAGRVLFANSRLEKSSNNVDRLKEYLARFGLRFEDISTRKW
jgi:transcriptional regulatory protein RtcR